MKNLVYLLLLVATFSFGQEDKEEKEKLRIKELQESVNYTWDANKALSEKDFTNAEVDYRKAIAKSTENSAASYNLGNAYYSNESFNEAFTRYKQAGETATSKEDKHKAYHNMGNVFMKEKQYEKAVEAYKQALRNNPTDEETRYNLALAQEMLKKQQDEDKKNQDKDKDDKKDEDKKEGDNEDKNEGDQKDDKNKDQGDEGDKGDEKEDNKEGDGDKKEEEKKDPSKGDKPEDKKGEQQKRPSQLSKQQVQNLLEAMQNEEKKVQEKMDAQKVKGVKTRNEKDW
ncbi:tetratricopeptide repeat protein [Cellulophaga sp. E16_2]|uniref:Tetratricopeptide TPR_1 repeat-containing protein n=1 Tax=Cellulophaga algicola (strain DSM 14237 / IC166 / ACAM 630) TaxID=688270 RepID=E6X7A7_CELAD|nr:MULTISPECIES: tetratricopeptide repeat protein [Cellulophaga]ADV48560.1 Tetratricopeptide TPR_1 repeat-containing protein [Cellulophaga algicola DSM 14237]MBO0590978.1 tetratricopeptide repeat protein [Cellulophaga sp. E16_2]